MAPTPPPDHEALRRLARGARCALCGDPIHPDEDGLVTPDCVADEQDPMWRFSDAAVHRTCFYLWEGRKSFVARYNRLARGLVAPDGTRPFLTAEGRLVRKRSQRGRGHRS